MKHREILAAEVKASFEPTVPLILHWDGKIMDDFTAPECKRVDRLPILVSGHDVVKLLSVPKLNDGTAPTMTQQVVECIDDWMLRNRLRSQTPFVRPALGSAPHDMTGNIMDHRF